MAKKSKSLPVDVPTTSYKPSKEDVERERRYRAESDIRTLKEADEIKKDKGRLRACKDHVKEQAKTVGKL